MLNTRFLAIVVFLSGASSLIFEAVFTRLLRYTFGNTAQAVSTVLACFLGGLSLGSYALGKWIAHRPASLKIYGWLELFIAVYGLSIPLLFPVSTHTYVSVCHRFALDPTGVTAVRFVVASLPVLIPSFCMGGTLPVIAHSLGFASDDFHSELNRLYAWNTFGAACGILICTYVLMPNFGVGGAIAIACAASLSIVAMTYKAPVINPPLALRQSRPAPPDKPSRLLLIAAFFAGAVALGYEVIWTQIVAFLVGTTVYAFGIMLFTVLMGLAIGARIASRNLQNPKHWAHALAASQLSLALWVLASLPLWLLLPKLFSRGSVGAYNYDLGIAAVMVVARVTYLFATRRRRELQNLPWYRTYEAQLDGLLFAGIVIGLMPTLLKYGGTLFAAVELLRFLSIVGMLIVPSILVGLTFPLLMNLYAVDKESASSKVGRIYAANTIGTVLGSLVTGFVLLSRLGSRSTLCICGVGSAFLGMLFAVSLLRKNRFASLCFCSAGLIIVSLLLINRGAWDAHRVTGSYAYLFPGMPGLNVYFAKEDIQGGLTTVVGAGPIRILMSNAKYQGDNAGGQITQTRFALIPALFMRHFDRALVIGLGTGNTLRTVAHFPFLHIDAAELSPQVIQAARNWFADVNDRVFDLDPRVSLSVADGRNFLLLSRQKYDMITIEITSLWVSGEGDLYNREFYELCRTHLRKDGVLQQWVALHHIRTKDVAVILGTASEVFPHVAFFQGSDRGHGLLIASVTPLRSDYAVINGVDRDPQIRRDLDTVHVPSMWSLLGEMYLYDSTVRKAVNSWPHIVSSDFYPYLEYQSPKGITLADDSVKANTEFLERFRETLRASDINFPSEGERNRVLALIAERRHELNGGQIAAGKAAN